MTSPQSPKPSLTALRTLVTVAASGSLKSASDSLGVTLSAVSRQMTQLEGTLGAQLLDRKARPVRLSQVGKQYAEALMPNFQNIDHVTADLFVKQIPTTLSLTTYPLFAVKWLLPRLPAFQRKYPSVDLTLRSTNQVFDLKTGEADVAIRLGAGKWDGCVSMKLKSEQIVAVCAPSLIRGKRRGTELLRTLPLIVTERAGRYWRSWLAKQGIRGVQVKGSRVFDDPLAAVEAAINGGGVVLTLLSLVSSELADGRLVEVLPNFVDSRLDHYLVVRLEAQRRPVVGQLIEWLMQEASVESVQAKSA